MNYVFIMWSHIKIVHTLYVVILDDNNNSKTNDFTVCGNNEVWTSDSKSRKFYNCQI